MLRQRACPLLEMMKRTHAEDESIVWGVRGDEMNSVRIVAVVLIVAGVLGLAYGGFTYTRDTHEATVGPIKLSITEKETINVPVWAGVGAIVIGGVLLVLGGRKG